MRSGFSFVEIVVTLGILSLLLGFGLFVALNSYHTSTANSERDTVVALLQAARARAMSNLGESSHGLHVSTSTYSIFRGDTYASRDADSDHPFPKAADVAVTGLNDVVFEALSGTASASGTISVVQGAQSFTISINNEGRIDW